MIKIKNKNGFTLIETMLYFVIIGIVFTVIIDFSVQVIAINMKSDIMHELRTNSDQVTRRIDTAIMLADSIDETYTVFDNDNGTLSLIMPDISKSPTKFYVTNGDVYMKEGNNSEIKINSDSIENTILKFQKVTVLKAPDQIILDAEYKPRSTYGNMQINEVQIHTAISLRQTWKN